MQGYDMIVPGSIRLYLLHAAALWFLCRSRYDKRKTALLCAGCAVLQSVAAFVSKYIMQYGKAWVFLVFMITFAIFCGVFFVMTSENVTKTLFVILSYAQMFMAVTFLAGALTFRFSGSAAVSPVGLRTILHAAMLLGYVLCFRRKFDEVRREVDQGWGPLCFLSLLFMFFICYLTLRVQTEGYGDADVLFFGLVILVMLAGYGVIFHTIHYMKESAAAGRMEQHQGILMQKLALMEAAVEEAGRARHDIRHHLLNIAEYARAGDNEALLAYLDEYMRETAGGKQIRFCADPAIDHVLTVYRHRAAQEGIMTDFAADVEEETGISEVDLVAVLANLLENAVHGCLASGRDEMEIRVRIRTRAGRLSVLVENTCAEEVLFENGLPRSGEREGIGISSILKCVAKYRGDVDFKCEGGIFTSRIIMTGRP